MTRNPLTCPTCRADAANQRAQLAASGLLAEFEAWIGCDLTDHLAEALVTARQTPPDLHTAAQRLGAQGGKATARKLTGPERQARGQHAIATRWAKRTRSKTTEAPYF